MDEIRIDNLEVYAYHGVHPEEREKGQNFYVSAVLFMDTHLAGVSDNLMLTVDYGVVCHFIEEWMRNNTCNLIEAAAEQLAEAILLEFDQIQDLKLEIRKPNAPIGLPFESVSVCIERGWHCVYLSIGSNMGDKAAYLAQGISELEAHPLIKVKKVSEQIVTKPYGGVEQDDFLNAALRIDTLLSPRELLDVIHGIEKRAERKRDVHWGPRTLDLDILYYDKLVYEDERLIIPHIDLQNRYFALKPLSELAPNFRHPILGKTVLQLLEELPD